MYAGQEAAFRTGHGTMDWFKIEKGVHPGCMLSPGLFHLYAEHINKIITATIYIYQGCILSPCLFNFYVEYIMRNAGLEESQDGIKIAGRLSITSDMQMTPPLWQKVKRN